MTELSKELFYKSTKCVDCIALVHPTRNSCFISFFSHLLSGIKGTGQFYALMYLVQLIMKGRRLTKLELQDMMKCLLSEAVSGGFYTAITLSSICCFRHLFGKFNYYCIGALPGFLGGLSIFVEVPKKRGLPTCTFLCLTFDCLLQEFEKNGYFKRTKSTETIIFILISTALLYMLRIVKKQNTYFWIFTPPKYKEIKHEESNHCTHDGSCQKEIIMSGIKYFSFGVTVQWLRSIIPQIHLLFKKRLHFLLLQSHHIKMGIFTGLYVSLYKAVSCLLYQKLQYDSPIFAVPAGAVAGLAYLYRPDFSIILMAFSNLLLVAERHLKTEKKIPQWPYSEIAFALCGGYLFQSRITKPSTINKLVMSVMNSYTNGKSDEVHARLKKLILAEQTKIMKNIT